MTVHHAAGADGNDFGNGGLLLGAGGQDDAALGGLFDLQTDPRMTPPMMARILMMTAAMTMVPTMILLTTILLMMTPTMTAKSKLY